MSSKFRTAPLLLAVASTVLVWGCPLQPVRPAENANENENVSDNENENENENAGGGTQAELPSKNIGFDLIGIHDPDNTESYDSDCIGCHGDRTNEVALDGVTPTAHARMLTQFGEGNERCVSCHQGGTDFFAYSSGGLREPVDMDQANCAVCHGAAMTPAFYAE